MNHTDQPMDRFISLLVPTTRLLILSGCLLVLSGCNMAANRANQLGTQAYSSGQFAKAINEFQRALTSNPQNADAYYNLGSSYYSLGKQQKNSQWVTQAENLFRQSISLNDQHRDAHRSLACLLVETNRENHAFDLINTWQQRYPQAAPPLIELARLYQEYGDNRRATDYLADALRLDSNNINALKAMGHVREMQGQVNLALENYTRVLQLDARQTDVAQRIGDLQTQLARAGGQITR